MHLIQDFVGHEAMVGTLAFTLSETGNHWGILSKGLPLSDLDCHRTILAVAGMGCQVQCGSSFGSNLSGRG